MTENYYKQYEPIFGVWRITRLIGEGFQSKVFEMEREDFGVTYKAALKGHHDTRRRKTGAGSDGRGHG